MQTKIIKTTKNAILFLFIITIINIIFSEQALSTEVQMLEASKNGLIQGLCFVYDLITGSFGKLVMCFFVLGLGWGFLIGEVKDHKTIFTFILAIAITFGGIQFAHFISGNDYSCDIFKKQAYLDENTIYNSGICPVTDIEEYMPGEKWRVCNTTIEEDCKLITSYAEEVDSSTSILDKSNNYITLYDCPEGYLKKDRNHYIIYRCNGTGLFSIVSDLDLLEYGKCLPACSIFDLKTTLNKYNFDNTNIKIVESSGYIKENYYSDGTRIDVQCRSDLYKEYTSDNIMQDGASITCTNGNFVVNGSCKPPCNITRTQYNSSVNTWKKCNNDTCSTTTPLSDTKLFYGDIVEIDTCKSGYFLNNKTQNLRLQCKDGGSWSVLQDGRQCSKICDVNDIETYHNAFVGLCSEDKSNCLGLIDNVHIFPNDTVGIQQCKTDFELSYNKANSPAMFTCDTDGRWENINDGGLCEIGCNINQIKSSIYTTTWSYYDYSIDNYALLPTNIKTVKSGYKIKPNGCIDGYSVNPNKQTTYTCKNGEFKPSSSLETNVCKQSCKFIDLIQMEQLSNAKTLIYSDVNGKCIDSNEDNICDEVVEINSIKDDNYSKINSYYTIQMCNAGYNINNNKNPVIFECKGDGTWKIARQKENFCKKDCKKTDLPINDNVIAWGYKNNDTNNEFVEFRIDYITNGSIVKPKTCGGGYNIDNFNTSHYLCNDGEFVIKNLSETLTVDNICTYKESFNCRTSDLPNQNEVSEWEYKDDSTDGNFVKFIVDSAKATGEVKYVESLKSGTEIKVSKCTEDFNYNSNNTSYYLCNNGIFIKKNQNNNETTDNVCRAKCKTSNLPNQDRVSEWEYKDENTAAAFIKFVLDSTKATGELKYVESLKSGTEIKVSKCTEDFKYDSNNKSYYLCDDGTFIKKNQDNNETTDNICKTVCKTSDLPNKDKVSIWRIIDGGKFSTDNTKTEYKEFVYSGSSIKIDQCIDEYMTHDTNKDNITYICNDDGNFTVQGNSQMSIDNICIQQ